MKTKYELIISPALLRAVIARVAILMLLIIVCAPGSLHAAMFGYVTNATGIYLINTQTAASTALYTGAPFNGTTFVEAAAIRPSDGMLFFLFNDTANQQVYRWDPVTPATAPVLIGTTGGTVPYIHRLGFHPSNGNLYGSEATPATRLWTINQTTGAATVAATISGLPDNESGDMAFNPVSGNLYMPISRNKTQATIYLVPLGGGAVTDVGTIKGMTNETTLNSAMFDSAGTLYIAGDGSGGGRLWTAPLTGGDATDLGVMGVTPQDFGSAPSPSPSISKAFSPTTVGVSSNSTLTITLSNSYANPQRGAAFTDTYPAGLVNAPVPGAATTCGGTVTAAPGGGSIALTGGTIPASSSCTVTVNVRSSTTGVYNNSIAAGGLTTILAFSDIAASDTLTVVALPTLTHLKTVAVTSDPVNGTVNPKLIPSAEALYTLRVTNSGLGVGNNVTIVDPLPVNTDFYAGDLGAPGSGPIQFTDGTPTSGLSWTFTSLASTTDSVDFSNDGGATWTYTPVPVGGYDPAVNAIRLIPNGIMNPAVLGNPNFDLLFRVRVQ